MKTRKLGWTELELTEAGLGTWAIGGGNWAFAWGPQEDEESVAAVRRAVDLGVNWVDTAPAYGLGHSEEMVGKALDGLSRKPWIATKCGRSWDVDRKLFPSLKKGTVQMEVESSLRRLRTDVIDLYQVHWPQPEHEIEEGWQAIARMVEQGKIRYAGVCNFSVAQLKRVQAIHRVASLQPPYSMVEREVEQELLSYCAEHQIGVVAYSPMQKGLLTGKVTREWVEQLAEDDHRRRDPRFRDPLLSEWLRRVEALRPVAERIGMSLAELAIAWVLRRPEVTSAIVGARRPQQVEATMSRSDYTIPKDALAEIDQVLKSA